MLLYCPPQLGDMLLFLCVEDSDGVVECESVVVEASLEIVAPTLPLLPILPSHVFLHLQQLIGIAHTHHKGTGSSDSCVEYIRICYALGWIASAPIFMCGLKGTQEEGTEFST